MSRSSGDESPPVMMGLEMPDIAHWSERVMVALGKNPSPFTGPGTNTFLIGTGEERILLDTGHGHSEYLPVLEAAMQRSGCRSIQQILLTHAHPDHIGGVGEVLEHVGSVTVCKMPWTEHDDYYPFEITPLADGQVIETEGARLRALHTPGHAPDHLCFLLEEENALFTGDNVLGVGTTVIPAESGDLGEYMRSLRRLVDLRPGRLYPGHGPLIARGEEKLQEYIAHRQLREQQILEAMRSGAGEVAVMVETIYAAYPPALHAAAGQSVAAHLLKLEAEGRVTRVSGTSGPPTSVRWSLV